MAIAKLWKLTLYGRSADQAATLAGLQRLGCVHVANLRTQPTSLPDEPDGRRRLRQALRYLETAPEPRPSASRGETCDATALAARALEVAEQQRTLRAERDELAAQVKRFAPWGSFDLTAVRDLPDLQVWLVRLPHHLSPLRSPEVRKAFEGGADATSRQASVLTSSDAEFEYWAVLSHAAPQGLPIAPQLAPATPLAVLRRSLEEIEQDLEQLEVQRNGLARWSKRLRAELDAADDEFARRQAAQKLLHDVDLFALQGWVPVERQDALRRFAADAGLALTLEEPRDADSPPTLLANPPLLGGAEDAVQFYITPAYRSWDPSWAMFASFSLFFAMIMADAGYGVVLLTALLIVASRPRLTEPTRRVVRLGLTMAVATIVYGMLVGSYFGMTPPAGSLLDRVVWKTSGAPITENRAAMMLLSASIGVAHLMLANLITAWQRRASSQALSNVGWAMALAGGLALAIARIETLPLLPWAARNLGTDLPLLVARVEAVGTWALGGGLTAVFLFSSARPLASRQWSDWAWRPLEGLLGLTALSKAFGDALSYLRLFALGLASTQLAATFNDLAADVAQIRGAGVLLGSLVFLAGHTLNLALGIVGGVVHGLRLNCIEFFSWSLTDEGYPFQAFEKKVKP
jgi:V/A-type H+-transporting ATPase subunit I